MYWVGVLTAGMTAFYVFRAWFMAFTGEYRGHAHPHESPLVMTGPLMILAVLSLGGGFINVPQFLEPMFVEGPENQPARVALGWCRHDRHPRSRTCSMSRIAALPIRCRKPSADCTPLVYNKYFVDEAYDAAVVEPLVEGSRTVLWRGMDAGLIDGMVNGVGRRARGIGSILRLIQSGNIRSYAAWVVLGSIALLLAIGFAGRPAMTLLDVVIFLPAGRVSDHAGAAQGKPRR